MVGIRLVFIGFGLMGRMDGGGTAGRWRRIAIRHYAFQKERERAGLNSVGLIPLLWQGEFFGDDGEMDFLGAADEGDFGGNSYRGGD